MKIIKKAYRVWVHSHIGEYPVFRKEDVEPIYAKNATEAKRNCDMWDAENEYGDKATWIDIKCIRAKEHDRIEYNGVWYLLSAGYCGSSHEILLEKMINF